VKKGRGSFLELAHGQTRSRLAVGVWLEDRNMNHARCEARARLLRAIPEPSDGFEQQHAQIPSGFDTRITAAVEVAGPGEAVSGSLRAFGAAERRCFAFVFETEASGPQAEVIVGQRLATMREISLGQLRIATSQAR